MSLDPRLIRLYTLSNPILNPNYPLNSSQSQTKVIKKWKSNARPAKWGKQKDRKKTPPTNSNKSLKI